MSRNAKILSPYEVDDSMSIADAAKLLFVSRRHVVELLERGKLKLHHKTQNDQFVTKASVLAYQAYLRAAAQTYHSSRADDE